MVAAIQVDPTVKQRAQAIVDGVMSIRLGSSVAHDLVESIMTLVIDATNGEPKPVLPIGTAKNIEPWEGKGWGIFHLDGDGDPVAIFTGRFGNENADRELARRQALDENDEDHLPHHDMGVLSCDVALLFWNSYDADPRVEVSK